MHGPQKTIYFDRNTPRLICLIALNCVFCYLGFLIAQGWAYGTKGSISIVVGWLTLVVFGSFLILGVIRLVKTPKTTLVFSPVGVLDRRLSVGIIPWSNIEKISQKNYRGHEFLGLQITEEGIQQLDLNLQGRLSFWLNSVLGRNTVWISTYEFDAPFSELWERMCQFLQEHNPKALPDRINHFK